MIAVDMMTTTNNLDGQIVGERSPYPTVLNVTITNQNESNKSKPCNPLSPALSRCWIPQKLGKKEKGFEKHKDVGKGMLPKT